MANSYDPRVARLIAQEARRRGLDPEAVLAVAMSEGGVRYGAVGDNGTSFGPFQLHIGGALPKQHSVSQKAAQAFANSPAGISYALRKMAESGAQGLTGQSAVSAIVRNFERPAAPEAEIERAMGHYGSFGNLGRSSNVGAPAPQPNVGGGSLGIDRQALASFLLGQSGQTAAGGMPDFSGLLQLAMQRQQLGAAQDTFGATPSKDTVLYPTPRSGGGGGSLTEMFYDPLGGIKNGQQIGAIGNHDDHVHIAAGSPSAQRLAIQMAKKMGLTVRDDGVTDKVDPVHTKTSYHYRTFGDGPLRQAADISGDPQKMAAFYRWAASTFRGKKK